ncbi:MAG: hypothetical protein H7Y37_07635 [Anaerolineae bacterium]|nr:hypothetical protein [Gloeobacterales cyanobacterium ES-bin-313]
MTDIAYLLWILTLFALAGALVPFCNWLTVDPPVEVQEPDLPPPEEPPLSS